MEETHDVKRLTYHNKANTAIQKLAKAEESGIKKLYYTKNKEKYRLYVTVLFLVLVLQFGQE